MTEEQGFPWCHTDFIEVKGLVDPLGFLKGAFGIKAPKWPLNVSYL